MSKKKQEIKKPVFFDFDDTLFKGDSLLYWMRYYYKKRPFRRFFLIFNGIGILLYLLRLIDGAFLKRIFLLPVGYEKQEKLEELTASFAKEELIPRCYREMWELLCLHQALGHQVVIISASATFYLKELKSFLPECIVLGTEVVFPKKGLFRFPQYEHGNIKKENKIHLLRRLYPNIEGECRAFAYSDSITDLPLLEFAEFPCCVHPDKELGVLAKKGQWRCYFPDGPQNEWRVRFWKLFLLMFLTEAFNKSLKNCWGFSFTLPKGSELQPSPHKIKDLVLQVKSQKKDWIAYFPRLEKEKALKEAVDKLLG